METSEEIIRAVETKEQIRKEHPEYSEEKVEARYEVIKRTAEEIRLEKGGNRMGEQPDWKNIMDPFEHCDLCAYKRTGDCKVYDRLQKYPRRPDGTGGLGMCIRIGGRGC